MVLINLENACDRVPRDLIAGFQIKGVPPRGYTNIVNGMYEGVITCITTPCGERDEFTMTMRLH